MERAWSRHGGGTDYPCIGCLWRSCRPGLSPVQEQGRDDFMSSVSSPIRVLVVDDHQLIRVGIATLLLPESDMKLVGEASNGREAISKFRECDPDITLMDLQMPEMSGFDAILAIRDEFPGARIIVLTTYAGDAQAVRAMKAGAQG